MNIIFHYPLPLNPEATSASGIRPLKMLEAFKGLGYHVDVVSGYSKERKRAISAIKDRIEAGVKYDFLYSESSTMPTILTDPHHLPLHPLLDFGFFRFCKKNNIKIGLFYRDIFWLFDDYGIELNTIKKFGAILSYKYDLLFYKLYLDKIYIPSLAMKDYIPVLPSELFSPLPPAHDIIDWVPTHEKNSRKLKIFYVGGLNDGYQMHTMIHVINHRDDVELTICTRENEWQSIKFEYPELSNNIKVIHKFGEDMIEQLEQADVVSTFVKPIKYWEFAVPFKLFEYLGHRKPIIASQGTLAGHFVAKNKIGWTIPYNEYELHKLLDQIVENPELIKDTTITLDQVAKANTWAARAEKVSKDLTC